MRDILDKHSKQLATSDQHDLSQDMICNKCYALMSSDHICYKEDGDDGDDMSHLNHAEE